ncbi:hypothetical protein GobsT_00770 [Gemmata obscuriglobus]|uniref:TIGR04255 family protein n=1 Tax=Gemmata obscuriglobus TaxID=114 RepID=A0A2Z3H6B5_9BACT|nr:hypothetical protein [Gemmata obscuriglobus]AWM41298.1 hypothetical protein C1280_32755 [Gemmata obscuriglobus]QEG25352.1 hypothetical protein GobsT_00770 [Gemmata obscuriglobus]VTR98318.1 Uncharacterized protein OS=Singulisphaera acidiphila (strain ATCC BAA-1392 / DSM 18658 / VKM B-2454 / MOB10) GN=Sinac_3598 PE=4 SV=1 [Gemmata obscuriglobus UQM 2246]
MNSYASLCDDFGVSTYVHGKLEMPSARETVLHFFEALQKVSPKMTEFEKRSDTEYMLEEERDSGSYRWASLDHRRLSTGFVNPPALEDADAHNERVLEMAAGHLDLGPLQTESVDVLYYFDFLYQGNHDEVVAEALTTGTPLESLVQVPAARVLHYQPTMMLALDEGCQLQARLSIETRTNAYQVRTNSFPESPVTVYFTVRQFWGKQPFKTFAESYHNQRRVLDELVSTYVVPQVINPLAKAISAKQ